MVTSFTFRLHPIECEVLAGPVVWALEDAREILAAYREFVATAPREVATIVTLRRVPDDPHLPVGRSGGARSPDLRRAGTPGAARLSGNGHGQPLSVALPGPYSDAA